MLFLIWIFVNFSIFCTLQNQDEKQSNDDTDSGEGCDEQHSVREENSGGYVTGESDMFASSDEDGQKQRTDFVVKSNKRGGSSANKGAVISDSDNEDENHENDLENDSIETYDSDAEMLMREKNFAVKKN